MPPGGASGYPNISALKPLGFDGVRALGIGLTCFFKFTVLCADIVDTFRVLRPWGLGV